MAKLGRGRLDGIYGMRTFEVAELYAAADRLEAQIDDPTSTDYPSYLRRWTAKIRRLADRKARALEHKLRQ